MTGSLRRPLPGDAPWSAWKTKLASADHTIISQTNNELATPPIKDDPSRPLANMAAAIAE